MTAPAGKIGVILVEDEQGQANRIELAAERFTIGKRAGNNLVLNRANISREHCVILRRADGYFIRDLESRNGAFINDRRVNGEVRLKEGDRIQLGDFRLFFFLDAPSGAPPRAANAPAAANGAAEETTGAIRAETRPRPARPQRIPVELKRKLHEQIIERLDLKHSDLLQKSPEEVWQRAADAARAALPLINQDIPAWLPAEQLIKEVVDEAVALGPIEDLLDDREVDEIMVNGWSRVYVERKGRIELTDKQFTSNDHVLATIRRILAPIGRRIDESSPMVDARLADGSRVNAIIAPLCLTGPTITIRKFAATPFAADDLVNFGSISRGMADFFQLCVASRRNICISGGTGSGKTTLLNVMSSFIPAGERIVTIEDAAELKLWQEHVISLEAKPPNIEGKGAIPIRKLVINSLRMRPDRIIVGECRGGEALDMLQAMNTGHDGSMTTVHANSVRDSLSRLETMVLMAGMELPSRAIREQLSSAINIIVQIARMPDGARKVTYVSEVVGIKNDSFELQDIFVFHQHGFSPEGKVVGDYVPTGITPHFIAGLRERGIAVDLGLFAAPDKK